jgi:hypothetical protein
VVGGLRELPSVKLPRLPRMADFAKWGEAVGRGLGWKPDTFVDTYGDNRREAAETSLESTPLGNALLELASTVLEWECSPTELYRVMTEKVGRKVASSAAWPKTTRMFACELRRLAPQLRMHGLSIVFSRTCDRRLVTLLTAGFLAGLGGTGDRNGTPT